jgi:hypothetical protein
MVATAIAMVKTRNRGRIHNSSPSKSHFCAGSAGRADGSGGLNRFRESISDKGAACRIKMISGQGPAPARPGGAVEAFRNEFV